MISWGIISSAMMFVRSEWMFYGMRFLLGVAEAGFFPGIIFYLTLWYPSRLRSTRTALFISAIAVSGVLGNPMSGLIMDTLFWKAGPGRLAMAIPCRGNSFHRCGPVGSLLSRQQYLRIEVAQSR